RERDEAVGQRPPEQRLAARPGDLELDARHELQRNVVDHLPVDDDVEAALLRRCDRAPLEPELALRIAVREGDGLAVEREAHETGLGGDRQQLGEAVPRDHPAHRVRTPLQPDARHAAPEGHGRRLAVGPQVERRARRVSRKRDPSRALHEPVLGEATGSGVEVERQARGPRALAMIRRALEEGAECLLVAVHHPVGPRAKRLGDLLARDRLGRRREGRQPPHHHRRHETPHPLTPPTSQPTSLRTALQTVAHVPPYGSSTRSTPSSSASAASFATSIEPTTQRAATWCKRSPAASRRWSASAWVFLNRTFTCTRPSITRTGRPGDGAPPTSACSSGARRTGTGRRAVFSAEASLSYAANERWRVKLSGATPARFANIGTGAALSRPSAALAAAPPKIPS